jgi:hypothetical protein
MLYLLNLEHLICLQVSLPEGSMRHCEDRNDEAVQWTAPFFQVASLSPATTAYAQPDPHLI